MDNYEELLNAYDYKLTEEKMDFELGGVISKEIKMYYTPENLAFCHSVIDHTSLNSKDSMESIVAFVNNLKKSIKKHNMDNVASICVFPNYAKLVKSELSGTGISVCCVSGGFPFSQTFPEIKYQECVKAVEEGADEIDVVIPVGEMSRGNYSYVVGDLKNMREACGDKTLKVIIESGELKSMEQTFAASILAMEAGADFIKTSTGKVPVNATSDAVYIMCYAIKKYYEKTGVKVGLKVAGGIKNPATAIQYMVIVRHILGKDWLTKDLFRIGASSLTNKIQKEYSVLQPAK
jgi:deoxyribose-phosphate aldolase